MMCDYCGEIIYTIQYQDLWRHGSFDLQSMGIYRIIQPDYLNSIKYFPYNMYVCKKCLEVLFNEQIIKDIIT